MRYAGLELETRSARLLLLLAAACNQSPAIMGDGGPDSAAPVDLGPRLEGVVSIRSWDAGWLAQANFVEVVGYGYEVLLQTQAAGDCTAEKVTPTPASGTPSQRSAGTIAITGGYQPVSLVPSSEKQYAFASGRGPLWAGGEVIVVKAQGGDVPPFELSAIAPSLVTIVEPAFMRFSNLVVDSAVDLRIAWNDGQAGNVRVLLDDSIFVPPSMLTHIGVVCEFPVPRRSGSVPTEILQWMSKGPDAGGVISIRTGSPAVFKAGDYTVTVIVGSAAMWASTGQDAAAAIFFQ